MTSREIKASFVRLNIDTRVSTVIMEGTPFISVKFQSSIPRLLSGLIMTYIRENTFEEDNIMRAQLMPDSNSLHYHFILPDTAWQDILRVFNNNNQPQQINPNQHGSIAYPSWTDVRSFEDSYPVSPLQYQSYPSPRQENETLLCANCNRKKRKNQDYIMQNEKWYCKKDYLELFQRCSSCSNRVIKEDMNQCDVCILDICDYCANFHDCFTLAEPEKETRRSIYKIAKEKKISLYNLQNPLKEVAYEFIAGTPTVKAEMIKINRFVGTEIEVENGTKFGLNVLLDKNVGIAHDGSLDRNTGIEIQTPPSSLDKLEDIVKNTCQVLKKRGYKSTIKCGLHVHLDARDFKNNHRKILQVIKTFYSIEDMIFSILPPSRWTSRFCQRLSKEYKYDNFVNGKKADQEWYKEAENIILNTRKDKKYDKSRYYGLNIHSIFHRGTLELRYHSGTISEYKILMWTNFCLKVLDYALNKYDAKTIQVLFDKETSWDKFEIMAKTFELPQDMQKYLLLRMRKFNPNFNIKFNQGKDKRDIEKTTIDKIATEMTAKIEELKPKITKNVRKLFLNSGIDNPEGQRPREFIQVIQERIDDEMKKLYPTQYGIMPIESGFIKDEEINQVISYIEQGRNLQREITTDEDGELDENTPSEGASIATPVSAVW